MPAGPDPLSVIALLLLGVASVGVLGWLLSGRASHLNNFIRVILALICLLLAGAVLLLITGVLPDLLR